MEVQKARWEDVILKEEFKINLKKDVYGFFDSEELYKSLSIPWKVFALLTIPPTVLMRDLTYSEELSCMDHLVS